MRIALIMDHFDPTRGGAENVAVWLATALAKRGHEVHVICHDVSPRINRYRAATQRASHDAHRSRLAHGNVAALPEGLHVHRLRGLKLSHAIGYRFFGQRAAIRCRRLAPDVTHSFTLARPGDIYQPIHGIYAALQAQAIASRGTASSASFKELMLHLSAKKRLLLMLEKKAFTRSSGPARVLTMGTLMGRDLKHFYAMPATRIVQMPTPLLTVPPRRHAEQRTWFRGNYRLDDDAPVALFVGHDFRRKGLRHAMDAIRHGRTAWQLVVVGLGKVREYIELAERWGISDRVRFIGPTAAIDDVFPAADALLLPTFYDPCPFATMEALTHRLPVVTSMQNGLADIILAHDAGIVVPTALDVPALSEALDSLATASARQKRAHNTVSALRACTVAADEYVDKMLGLYEAVIKKRS